MTATVYLWLVFNGVFAIATAPDLPACELAKAAVVAQVPAYEGRLFCLGW